MASQSNPTRTMIVAGAAILIVGSAYLALSLFVHKVPPDVLTRSSMIVTQSRLRDYYSATGKLPCELSDLPPVAPNRDNGMADAWGHPIGYRVDTTNRVILESMGRNGKLGGDGMDKDIFLVFDPSTPMLSESFSHSRPEDIGVVPRPEK